MLVGIWMDQTQLQNVFGKIHVSISDFQLFFNFRCMAFCSAYLELFSDSNRLVFCILQLHKWDPCNRFVVADWRYGVLYLSKCSAQVLPLYFNPYTYGNLLVGRSKWKDYHAKLKLYTSGYLQYNCLVTIRWFLSQAGRL